MNSKERLTKVPSVSPKTHREQRKEVLQESAEKSLEAINTQLGDFKKIGTNALIIGGTIVAAYAITELLLPSPETKPVAALPLPEGTVTVIEKKDEEQEDNSFIWTALKGVATSVLLALAKEKLMELIEHLTERDAKPSTE